MISVSTLILVSSYLYVSVLAATTSEVSTSASLNVGTDIRACLNQPSFYSCENTTAIANTCCSPSPGGLVLHTQFWSTYGQNRLPRQSWTIHGAWPDNCDGSFESYCDLSRQFDPVPSPATLPSGIQVPAYKGPGVKALIKKFKRGALLDYMDDYWVNRDDKNEVLWAHEFSKHATCTSTFDISCYGPSYQQHEDIVDYFESAVRAFQLFPTYKILAAVGIVPSNSTAYTLNQLQTAIKQQVGAIPFLGCSNNGTVLSEVWYFNHVYGSDQFGSYKPVDSTTRSSCSTTAPIWYYERTFSSEHEVRS